MSLKQLMVNAKSHLQELEKLSQIRLATLPMPTEVLNMPLYAGSLLVGLFLKGTIEEALKKSKEEEASAFPSMGASNTTPSMPDPNDDDDEKAEDKGKRSNDEGENTGERKESESKTWNQFQSDNKGAFKSRREAAEAWENYKEQNNIKTPVQRSQAAKRYFLKKLAESGKAPKWMNQWLKKGKVPPGYQVDHLKPLSIGGKDTPLNMRLKDIAAHQTRHKFYRPWEF